jgi:uncharacterized membrane protein YphA (DoxX/SURF4 family)
MKLSHNKDLGLLILRVVVGIVFAVHGYMKFMGIAGTIGFFGGLGLPAFMAYVVATVELVGGLSLIVGFGSKVASALLAFTMLVAIVKVHGPKGFSASAGAGGYEYVLTLLAATLGIFFAGPGKYSVGACCGCPVSKGACPADCCCDCDCSKKVEKKA